MWDGVIKPKAMADILFSEKNDRSIASKFFPTIMNMKEKKSSCK